MLFKDISYLSSGRPFVYRSEIMCNFSRGHHEGHFCEIILNLDQWFRGDAFVCLFDLILYVPSTIFQLYRDGSFWVEPVLS